MGLNIFSHKCTLENAATGDTADVVIMVRYEYDPGQHTLGNGDPGIPPTSNIEYQSWYMQDGSDKPAWITPEILYGELERIDPSDYE